MHMATHTAVATTAKGEIEAISVPTEAPGDGEVLIKLEYGALIPPDAYATDRGLFVQGYPLILGFSAAGVIHKVGSGVEGLKVGDRVVCMTSSFSDSRRKALQEYVVLPWAFVGRVPDSLPLEQAATVPDNFVTAFYTLFNQLGLPIPSSFPANVLPPLASTPILIYGGSSSAGLYMIQLLHLAGYKKIFITASKKNHEYLQSLGASHTFDYNDPALVENIEKALGGDGKLLLAVDCIAVETNLIVLGKIMSPLGKVAILLPIKEGGSVTNAEHLEMYWEVRQEKTPFPKGTELITVRTGALFHKDIFLRDNLMPKILPELLNAGLIKPNRVCLMDKGTFKDRVGTGLALLRENKISAEKVVVKFSA